MADSLIRKIEKDLTEARRILAEANRIYLVRAV